MIGVKADPADNRVDYIYYKLMMIDWRNNYV
jgi:hypothetical protein